MAVAKVPTDDAVDSLDFDLRASDMLPVLCFILLVGSYVVSKAGSCWVSI